MRRKGDARVWWESINVMVCAGHHQRELKWALLRAEWKYSSLRARSSGVASSSANVSVQCTLSSSNRLAAS